MDTRELVGAWVRSFGDAIKTPLRLQENGICAIDFGNGRVCSIEVPEDDGPIVVHAPLLSLAGSARETVFARALALNLFGSGTGGCTIALDEKSDRLVLCVSRGAGALDATSFAALVGTVIATAVRLAAELGLGEAQKFTPSALSFDSLSNTAMRV